MPELQYTRGALHGAEVMVAFYGPNREYAFVWHGGAYIDVCFKSIVGSVDLYGQFYKYGSQCISVYDYSANETIIPFGDKEAFLSEVREFIKSEMPMRMGD